MLLTPHRRTALLIIALLTTVIALHKHRWATPLRAVTATIVREHFYRSFDANAKVRVAFGFRLNECSSNLAQIDTLNALANMPGVEVIGILVPDGADRDFNWQEILRGNDIRFHVHRSKDAFLALANSSLSTPFVVEVLPRRRGRKISASALWRQSVQNSPLGDLSHPRQPTIASKVSGE